MTIDEMSNSFDALLNSYALTANFGEGSSKGTITLDEYEKSVLLTQAQDIIVKSYFTPKSNQVDGGFDDSERRQADFSSLIKVAEPSVAADITDGNTSVTPYTKYDDRSTVFKLDSNTYKILCILNEKVVISEGQFAGTYVIVPIHYREYDRLMSQAYAQPNKKQMWRLFQNTNTNYDVYSEIIPHENIVGETLRYIVRYVKRPAPLITADLDGLQIDGQSSATANIEIPPVLHRDVVSKAVELAIATRGGRTEK